MGLIPGQGTKILQAALHGQRKKDRMVTWKLWMFLKLQRKFKAFNETTGHLLHIQMAGLWERSEELSSLGTDRQ